MPITLTGEAFSVPKRDNDNMELAPPWQTPAEVLQLLRRVKREMQEELKADFTLRTCTEYQQRWELLRGAEQFALWLYYGIRK